MQNLIHDLGLDAEQKEQCRREMRRLQAIRKRHEAFQSDPADEPACQAMETTIHKRRADQIFGVQCLLSLLITEGKDELDSYEHWFCDWKITLEETERRKNLDAETDRP